MRRLILWPFLFTCLFMAPVTAPAQEARLATMRELLDGGYYALAAQVTGPELVRAAPQNPAARLLFAEALLLVDNPSAALRQLDKGKELSLSPLQKRQQAYLLAQAQAALGNTLEAKHKLAKLFATSPSYEVAMTWGQVAWQEGDLKTALRAFAKAEGTQQGARSAWPSLNQGRILMQQKRYQNAIAKLNEALDVLERQPEQGGPPSPSYTEAFYRLGQAYEGLGSIQEAISNYQAAETVDPDYTPATEALTRLNP